MNEWILGLATGYFFGFLLQRGRVLRFEKQVGAMLLRDMTILKFMLSAIVVGMIGLHILVGAGVFELSHKAMNLGAVMVGGTLFGIGWAFMGFCPGTSVGAVGEGRWHAIFAALGMVVGAAVYAALHPWFSRTVSAWRQYGNISLPEALGVNPWVIIPVFVVAVLLLFAFFERKRL